MDEQQLWDKAIEEARNNWTRHTLENSSGEHCALGCLGYARWGYSSWGRQKVGRWDYKDLREDGTTSAMVAKLADVIREQYSILSEASDHTTVMVLNDTEGQNAVVTMMEKARNL